MNILAIDTSTTDCGAAVIQDDKVRSAAVLSGGQTHARHLLPLIHQVLATCGASLAEMDGFAVTRGPGSFTGLRIGISTVKGLVFACEKPLTSVSTLEALAYPFLGYPYDICALIDARKKQVYACRFRSAGEDLLPVTEEQVLFPEEAAAGLDGPCLFVGSGAAAYRETITAAADEKARFLPDLQNKLRPEAVAYLGRLRLSTGDTEDPGNLSPVYIRQPDAIINRGRLEKTAR